MQPVQASQPSTLNQVVNGFIDALGYHFPVAFLDNPFIYPLYLKGTLLNLATLYFNEDLRIVGIARLCIFGGCLAKHLKYHIPLNPRFCTFLVTHIARGLTEIYGSKTVANFWIILDLVNAPPRIFQTFAIMHSMETALRRV